VPTRALTWAIFVAAAGSVAAVCVAILRPFANVIAWSAVFAILGYPLQEALVRRTRRVALSALLTSLITVLVCLVPLLVLAGVAVNEYAALAPRSFQDGAFALLGGLSVFGALGVVLGPVAFATAAAIVETLRQPAVASPFSRRQS
jgi:predicted PurR-regulated permease PerM